MYITRLVRHDATKWLVAHVRGERSRSPRPPPLPWVTCTVHTDVAQVKLRVRLDVCPAVLAMAMNLWAPPVGYRFTLQRNGDTVDALIPAYIQEISFDMPLTLAVERVAGNESFLRSKGWLINLEQWNPEMTVILAEQLQDVRIVSTESRQVHGAS